MKLKWNWRWSTLIVLILMIGLYWVFAGSIQNVILGWAEHYMEKQMAEYEALSKEIWDLEAKRLRQMSIPERIEFLEQKRENYESDGNPPEDAEVTERLMNEFIRKMNDRGVYFE